MVLAEQSGADFRFDLTSRCKKQLAKASFARCFPLESRAARSRQKSQPLVFAADRYNRLLVAVEFKIGLEPADRQWDDRARSDGKVSAAGIAARRGECCNKIKR